MFASCMKKTNMFKIFPLLDDYFEEDNYVETSSENIDKRRLIFINFDNKKEEEENCIYRLKFNGYIDNVNKYIDGVNCSSCAIIYKNGNAIRCDHQFSYIDTNNYKLDDAFVISDLQGLLLGMERLISMKIKNVVIETDRNLIIDLMEEKVSSTCKSVLHLCKKIKTLKKNFDTTNYEIISRNKNQRCVELCKRVIDEIMIG